MQTVIARPETAAEYITWLAGLISELIARVDDGNRLAREALADPAAEGLRDALALRGAGLHDAARAVRACQPTVDLFAAILADAGEGRRDQRPAAFRPRRWLAAVPPPRG